MWVSIVVEISNFFDALRLYAELRCAAADPRALLNLTHQNIILTQSGNNMSSSRLPTSGSVLARAVKCYLSCNVHQIAANTNASGALKHSFQPIKRARVTGIDGARRAYATSSGQRHDVQRYRKDVDERGRLGYYILSKQQGALHMESAKANAIVKEFLAKQKTMDHRSNIQHLATSVSLLISAVNGMC
jgi:hypothetical protein